MAKKKKSLTLKQERFCHEYVKDLNATDAAKRAGYSKKSATAAGYNMLRLPEVQKKVSKLNNAKIDKARIDADFVLKELYRIASSDVGQIFNDDGSMKPINEIPEDVRRAISGIDMIEYFEGKGKEMQQVGFIKKIKLWSKDKALRNLGEHLKLFIERVDHTNSDGSMRPEINVIIPSNKREKKVEK